MILTIRLPMVDELKKQFEKQNKLMVYIILAFWIISFIDSLSYEFA